MLAARFKELKHRIAKMRARRHRHKLHQTRIIAITGSQGKTTAAKLSHHLLSSDGPSLLSAYWNNITDTRQRLMKVRKHDRYAVFELAENRSKERDNLADALDLLKPHVALVTLVSSDHRSEFRSRDAAAAQIAKAVRAVQPEGIVLLNADDPLVLGMGVESKAPVVTYGEADFADYRATDIEVNEEGWLQFTCIHGADTASFEIRVPGRHLLTPVLGAIAVASESGISLPVLSARARSYETVPGRCSFHRGQDGTIFICDTAKAVHGTLDSSFAVCNAFPSAPRRTIVIGTISDYPGKARPKYQKAYLAAREQADRVIFVGPNAHRARAFPEDLSDGAFMATESMREFEEYVRRSARPREVFLLKSSASDHLERIALAAEGPVTCQIETCRLDGSCFNCDLLRSSPSIPTRFLLRKFRKLRARFSRVPQLR